MKVIARQNRDLVLINAQNTQNENDAEKITLQVPEQYEDFNKKIVFVTPAGNVWDIITNNEYLIKKAITKYKQVDFYIWLTKEDVDFRSQTKTLKFYHNVDASDEITDEEIGRVNTVINLLEEEITKVNNLETEIDGKLEEVDTAIENIHTAIQGTENLDLDAEKVGQTTTITLTKKDGTVKTVHVDGTGDMLTSVYDIDKDGIVDNAEKVNGHTVESDVPANAKFTDTTYASATQESDGIMSKEDKQKLDSLSNYDDTEIKNDISAINANVKANYYNKADTDTKLDAKANTTDVYTKTETDTKLNAKANSSDVYTKEETDTKMNAKQDKLTAGTGIEITGENIINNIQGNYSTEEVKIGKWINGKPIYRQTFGFNVPNLGTETYFYWTESFYTANSISNVDEIINVKSFYKRSDNTYQPVPNNHSQPSHWASGIYDFSGTGFMFWAGDFSNVFQINYLTVTIEYTKTTD